MRKNKRVSMMKIDQFPTALRPYLIPEHRGRMVYECLGCKGQFDAERLLYVCPTCRDVLLIRDLNFERLTRIHSDTWRKIFDYRKMLNEQALKGIFRYYEFMAPVIPLEDILYLGEADTPLVAANGQLKAMVGMDFYFKSEGLNPSASFKDRGMACALSYLNTYAKKKRPKDLIAVCASTGDTSAAAALYAAYMGDSVKCVVLLPHGRITPQQLAQPLGNGATVLEIPGLFDDCMKVVELLAENYQVALLNSKNSWRILGQESFSFEVAQAFDYDVSDKVVVVPIGNAGNITAVMTGFLKFHTAGIIKHLPKIVGVQSEHADPVYRFYREEDPQKRRFTPVAVRPSVAQAAMIGDPVSMPRVIDIARKYNQIADRERIFFVQVKEQEIMDAMIVANRNGNIACTQGGETLAGLMRAIEKGYVGSDEVGVLNSTAHMLKFIPFQEMYFNNDFGPEFEIKPRKDLKNAPRMVKPRNVSTYPKPGSPLPPEEMRRFVHEMAGEIGRILKLEPIDKT